MEYLDDRALNIYTDGSSLQRPRRGGVGIVFVSVDEDGQEQCDEHPMPGYPGGSNQQMELQAPIDALSAIIRRQAPVDVSGFKKIVIWSDSQYLTGNILAARGSWQLNGWMTREGNPVVNAALWKELIRVIRRIPRSVEFEWVKGHKQSPHNKRADGLAKQSARSCGTRTVSSSTVRRRLSPRSTEPGSVGMLGQRVTILIVTEQPLEVQGMSRYRYKVISRNSPFHGCIDWIFAENEIILRAGHTYYVRAQRRQQPSPHREGLPRDPRGGQGPNAQRRQPVRYEHAYRSEPAGVTSAPERTHPSTQDPRRRVMSHMSPTPNARIISEIDARIAELEPLLREYEQLKTAREVLTQDNGTAPPSARRPRRATAAPARTTARGRRAPRGANREAILAFLGAHPAATVAQIAQGTGIARPTLHTTVSQLKRAGVLRPDGAGVSLAGATPAAASAAPRRRRAARAAAVRAARPRAGRRAPAARPSGAAPSETRSAREPAAKAPAPATADGE